jgi:hypothetical protein
MIALYIIQKYLNRLNDSQFINKWETHFIKYSRYYFIATMIYFVVGVGIISNIFLMGVESIFLMLLVFFLVTAFYGFAFLVRFLQFISYNNQRLLQVKFTGDTESFSKDNVVDEQ